MSETNLLLSSECWFGVGNEIHIVGASKRLAGKWNDVVNEDTHTV